VTERRPLIDGLKATPPPLDAALEQAFVYGAKAPAAATPKSPAHQPPAASPALSRVPISTRIRSDLAGALKRASLERQLSAVEPNTLQDILEEAIEPWLRSNGYLS
jgi:hypothetical protein